MEQIKTKTMAEIYLKQGHLQEAYDILKTLAEKDPSDQEVREKLRILNLKMGLISPPSPSSVLSKEERIEFLERWLTHIQSRRKK
jgi:Tetratricopeptide repeat